MSFEIQLRRVGAIALVSAALVSCGGSDKSATTPTTASPTASVAPGPYTTAQSVTLSDTTSGAVIYYTTDGTTPTTSSTQYTAAISITTSTILEVVAIAPGHSISTVVGGGYTIGPAALAAGIWVGEDSEATPKQVFGFVLASGQAIFLTAGTTNASITQFSAGVTVTGTTAFTSNLSGFSNFPATFGDASTSGTGTFDATLSTENTLTGALTFASVSNTPYDSTWTLSYSSISLTGSKVSALAGTYVDASTTTDPVLGATITISAAGDISSTAATSGCVMTGAVGTTDPTTNIYQISYSFTGCTGAYSDLNTVQLDGLAVLNDGQLLSGANTASGAATPYGLVLALNLNSN